VTEKSKWQIWKEAQAQVKPWDLLNSENHTTKQIQQERYAICLSCPDLIQSTKTCKLCGCFMNQKTKLKMSSCPAGRWGSVNE
jgi:hypothetical protein